MEFLFVDLNISELTAQFQSAAIEAMIAQRPKMSEVTFRGYKITVPTEKLAALLVRIDDFGKKENVKVEDYEEVLVELRDAIQTVRDLINDPVTFYTLFLRSKILSLVVLHFVTMFYLTEYEGETNNASELPALPAFEAYKFPHGINDEGENPSKG